MTKIIIVGAGVAGCVLADLFRIRGYHPMILEKDQSPGGMCKSYYKDGFIHEYGPHILAAHNCSDSTIRYIKKKIEVVDTSLSSASFINEELTPYPPSIKSAEAIGLGDQVRKELSMLPATPDESNFETYLKTKVGDTLYRLFFESFTRKFWGIDPKMLSADWAKMRHLGEKIDSTRMFFHEKWCAYPKGDWNDMFPNLLKGISVQYNAEIKKILLEKRTILTGSGEELPYDLVVSTLPIDDLFGYQFGKLDYTGYKIRTEILDKKYYQSLNHQPISMTYYPGNEHPFCRVTDYGSFQQKTAPPYDRATIVTYEYPDRKVRLYPFTDKANLERFDRYVREASKYPHLVVFGRLGLYKYLTTDTTVEMAFRTIPVLGDWMRMDSEHRYNIYQEIIGDWNN